MSPCARPLRLLPLGTSLAVGLLLAASLSGCRGESAPALPNILLVTLDTTRADHLGSYGYFRDTSPHFDALARESVFFERAVVPMATTLPTHLSILTATYPLEHGVLANTTHGGKLFVPSPGLRSFAAYARDAGYRTGGFVSAAPLKRGTGVELGFDAYEQPDGHEHPGAITTDRALAWLGDSGGEPFFLWVHYYDAHWPFTPPAPYAGLYRGGPEQEAYIQVRRIAAQAPRPLAGVVEDSRAAMNAYDEEIRYQDDQLARLLDAVRQRGSWDRTAILVVADHGEGLGQHGEAGHGGTWDEQIHAPMLIRVPGVAPRKVSQTVSAVGAMPTLLALLGLQDQPTFAEFLAQASSPDALAEGGGEAFVLSQDTGREREADEYRYSLTSDRWKYFRIERQGAEPGEALYDLANDPFELRDVAQEQPEQAAALRARLETRIRELRERGEALRGGSEARTIDAQPEVIEQLRALGYLEPADEPEAAAEPEERP